MSALFTLFLAQFIAPIPIGMGIAAAFVSRTWWHVLVTAIVAAGVSEVFQRTANADHLFDPLAFLIAIFAAWLWAAWFYWIRLSRRQQKQNTRD